MQTSQSHLIFFPSWAWTSKTPRIWAWSCELPRTLPFSQAIIKHFDVEVNSRRACWKWPGYVNLLIHSDSKPSHEQINHPQRCASLINYQLCSPHFRKRVGKRYLHVKEIDHIAQYVGNMCNVSGSLQLEGNCRQNLLWNYKHRRNLGQLAGDWYPLRVHGWAEKEQGESELNACRSIRV